MTIEINKNYNENCLDTMSRMPDNFVDLVLTSPPYDKLRKYDKYSFEFEAIAIELYRVIKKGGVVVWIVGDSTKNGSETGTSFKQALYFKHIGFNLHDTMIYQKNNPPPVGGSTRYYQHFEYMFVLTKGKIKTFNPIISKRRNRCNDRRTERTKNFTRKKNGEFVKNKVYIAADVKIGNIWKYNVGCGQSTLDKIAFEHPAIFPEELVNDHIVSWSNTGDLIYDPFSGSGTTIKMAKIHNRDFIGSELSKKYYEISEIRNRG